MKKLDKAIKDVAYVMDSLLLLREILESGDCNECAGIKSCQYAPKPGQMVRYNCPFFKRTEECQK